MAGERLALSFNTSAAIGGPTVETPSGIEKTHPCSGRRENKKTKRAITLAARPVNGKRFSKRAPASASRYRKDYTRSRMWPRGDGLGQAERRRSRAGTFSKNPDFEGSGDFVQEEHWT
jgi:hypothetical protein